MQVCRTGKVGVAFAGDRMLGTRLVPSGPGAGQARAQVHRGAETHVQDDFQDAPDFDVDGDGDRKQRGAIDGHVARDRQASQRFDAAGGEKSRIFARGAFVARGHEMNFDTADPNAKIDVRALRSWAMCSNWQARSSIPSCSTTTTR